MITCVLLRRISQYCTTPLNAKCPINGRFEGHYTAHTGQDNEQSDKKGGCFHHHRKVWRILSDGEMDFVPQQRRMSARRNVILNSVWWLTWIDSKSVSTVCLHMIIVTMGVYRQSSFDVFHDQDQQVSPHRQRKGSLLSITQQWLTQPATAVATFSWVWNSWLVTTVRLVVPGKRGFTTRFRVEHRAVSEWTSFVSRGGFVT